MSLGIRTRSIICYIDDIDMCRERDESLDDEVFFIPSFGTELCNLPFQTTIYILDWQLTLGILGS